MSEENLCLAFFEGHMGGEKGKVPDLQKEPAALEWEGLSASSNSPGIVLPDELALRLAFQPLHIDPETGSLKPSAVSDVKDKGLSVDRLKYLAREESIRVGRARAAEAVAVQGRTARELRGVVTLKVGEVRAIRAAERQAFGVYDTALPHNMAHADVCQLVPEGQLGRSARARLLELCDSHFEILTD